MQVVFRGSRDHHDESFMGTCGAVETPDDSRRRKADRKRASELQAHAEAPAQRNVSYSSAASHQRRLLVVDVSVIVLFDYVPLACSADLALRLVQRWTNCYPNDNVARKLFVGGKLPLSLPCACCPWVLTYPPLVCFCVQSAPISATTRSVSLGVGEARQTIASSSHTCYRLVAVFACGSGCRRFGRHGAELDRLGVRLDEHGLPGPNERLPGTFALVLLPFALRPRPLAPFRPNDCVACGLWLVVCCQALAETIINTDGSKGTYSWNEDRTSAAW